MVRGETTHPSFDTFCVFASLAFVLAMLVVVGHFSLAKAEIEKEIVVAAEHEATERTEERSQFWQKLIPWGENESEADDGV